MPDDKAAYIVLDKNLKAGFLVKDCQAGEDFDEIVRLFLKPAVAQLVTQFEVQAKGTYVFAKLTEPYDPGSYMWRADYSDLSFRCHMRYDPELGGTKVIIQGLFGTY